ncbi:NAD(P)-bd-dom domain-containing protein [Fusarium keratoplasticum]|uniref:NAD(P)-bd-dom domain-containing protein n=1 Tax=Fusarium keratoplasticum TaxID=1328300 RepID=A0ACC0QEQ5_9HYPO|nr:NAD(P)-bd-dom domain-containing protein [Fusarium keratoplasticum]KAI8652481.1 NAD(P)-bd-dom domain-containing protein [Fusarium keratoplasticum]KAI8653211.1 NAD(P)-bd-dom domain-containing protein [Fusarium keratoplasticum]
MTKIFLTGATGYIGGDGLHTLVKAHPEYEITALVRNKEKGDLVASQYPSVKLVYGDLDDFELLAEQVSKADITCHWASCEHEAAAKAIAEGISRKAKDDAGFVIHLSGADIICYPDLNDETYGIKRDQVFDDWDGIGEVTSPPENAPHKEVDLAILGISGKNAIVCPPTIYGPGRGPGNQRSIQVPELALHSLKRGAAITVKEGENIWNSVHVHDLSKLWLKLVEAAAQGGGKADWGSNGYYFVENGDFSWKAIAEKIAKEAKAQGLWEDEKVESLSVEDADKVWSYASFFWGTNSRSRAIRARKILDWEPVEKDIFDDVVAVVKAEAASLKLAE